MYFLIKLDIRMIVQHHIPQIRFFKGSKSRIGVNFSTGYPKTQSTPLNVSSSSVIGGITTPFALHNIDQNDY